MKNLIYQFWNGDVPYYAKRSSSMMKSYADYVGAEYRVDYNSSYVKSGSPEYMNCFRPIHDASFHEYDNVLFLDMDIFPVENIKDNIFELNHTGIALAQEIGMTDIRYSNTGRISGQADEKWAKILKDAYDIILPRDDKNRLMVYNSGVVLYSQQGLIEAQKAFIPINEYQSKMRGLDRFYSLDQNYLHAMLFTGTVNFTELDTKWNSQIYYNGQGNPRPIKDNRTDKTQLVHLQLRGRNTLTDEKIYDIVNLPIHSWRHRK